MIGRKIAQLRESFQLTQSQLAQRTGFHQSTVCRIESGLRQPSARFLRTCTELFGVSPGELDRATPPSLACLHDLRPWLREVFPAAETRAVQPLRTAFTLARYTPRGRELVEALDRKRHPGPVWSAIKTVAGLLNGPEQRLFLQALEQKGQMQEITPWELGFPLPVVHAPRHWWLGFVVRSITYFPQVVLHLPNHYCPRLDFLAAVPTRPPLFVDIEADGPTHEGRQAQDDRRARQIGLPVLRVATEDIDKPEFWRMFERRLREMVENTGRIWKPRRRQG